MPYQRNPYFMGHDKLLKFLHRRLCRTKKRGYNNRVALYGLGGVGKTQTAIEYVYRNRKFYKGGVYWISGVDRGTLFAGFQEIAKTTNCMPITGDPLDIVRGVLAWMKKQEPWLLVIDNLDDVSVVDQQLPEGSITQHTLITTRNSDVDSIPAEGMEVEVLSTNEAAELLRVRSNIGEDVDSAASRDEAQQIVKVLGCLPLAIEQAAGYIREASKDISSFLAMYSANRKYLLARTPRGNRSYPSSVAATWKLSFDVIASKCPAAANLLQLFAFLNPDTILIDFLQAGLEGLDSELQEVIQNPLVLFEALFELERFSLIRRSITTNSVSIHRLVQAAIQDDLSPDKVRVKWEMIVNVCKSAFPQEASHDTRPQCRRYQNQVLIPLLNMPIQQSESAIEVLYTVGSFLEREARYEQAEPVTRKAIRICRLTWGKDNPRLVPSMNLLFSIYWEKFCPITKLLALSKKLVQLAQMLDRDDPRSLICRYNRARAATAKGWRTLAAEIQESVVSDSRRILGSSNQETLKYITYLGDIYREKGERERAAGIQEEALKTSLSVLGEDHQRTIHIMNHLSLTYASLNRSDACAQLDEKVLASRRRILGDEHPWTLNSICTLGGTYIWQGRFQESIELFEEALEGEKNVFGFEKWKTQDNLETAKRYQNSGGTSPISVELRDAAGCSMGQLNRYFKIVCLRRAPSCHMGLSMTGGSSPKLNEAESDESESDEWSLSDDHTTPNWNFGLGLRAGDESRACDHDLEKISSYGVDRFYL
jgi:tetratricopeptide (TPR) repeat protein